MTENSGSPARTMIVGGAGFIGSHFTDRLLADGADPGVTIYDNFSSGIASLYVALNLLCSLAVAARSQHVFLEIHPMLVVPILGGVVARVHQLKTSARRTMRLSCDRD